MGKETGLCMNFEAYYRDKSLEALAAQQDFLAESHESYAQIPPRATFWDCIKGRQSDMSFFNCKKAGERAAEKQTEHRKKASRHRRKATKIRERISDNWSIRL